MLRTPDTFALVAALLIFFQCTVLPVQARESGCKKAADVWILELGDAENSALFRRHAQANCAFSGKWVKDGEQLIKSTGRDRLCNDLVLLWTHKKCGYFRDYINPDAYEPCKTWTRQMFRRCMDNDVSWFLPTPEN